MANVLFVRLAGEVPSPFIETDLDLFTAAGFDLVATRPANEIGARYVFRRRGTLAGGSHD